jgi:hypothetical protein
VTVAVGEQVECPSCGWPVRLNMHGTVPTHLERRVRGFHLIEGSRVPRIYMTRVRCDGAGEVVRTYG